MPTLLPKPLLLSLMLLGAPSQVFSQAQANPHESTALFAGGRYWGIEYVFEHVRGVHYAMSGLARSPAAGTPAGLPKPVEAVRIDYDPAVVSYKQLLAVFFTVAHDPTSLDRQGPDTGAEYRGVVFPIYPGDSATAAEYITALTKSRRFSRPIVTQLRSMDHFTPADAGQQDYVSRHPADPYVVQNDIPMLARLKKQFPALYTDQRAP